MTTSRTAMQLTVAVSCLALLLAAPVSAQYGYGGYGYGYGSYSVGRRLFASSSELDRAFPFHQTLMNSGPIFGKAGRNLLQAYGTPAPAYGYGSYGYGSYASGSTGRRLLQTPPSYGYGYGYGYGY